MIITKTHFSNEGKAKIDSNPNLLEAYEEVCESICSVKWPLDSHDFTINSTTKNNNGVVPIKDQCYKMLEETYGWFREKPLAVLKTEKLKGGPIDVYKEFSDCDRVGLEFETGNISSAHRSMNKLILGCRRDEIDLAIILLPVFKLSYYLTDRVSNYEELEPYYELMDNEPFIIIGFDAESYNTTTPLIPKGSDGMSKRSKKLWKENDIT